MLESKPCSFISHHLINVVKENIIKLNQTRHENSIKWDALQKKKIKKKQKKNNKKKKKNRIKWDDELKWMSKATKK